VKGLIYRKGGTKIFDAKSKNAQADPTCSTEIETTTCSSILLVQLSVLVAVRLMEITGTQVVRETLQKGGYVWNCVSQFQSFPKSAVPVDDPWKLHESNQSILQCWWKA
jgi:hypothetical protein